MLKGFAELLLVFPLDAELLLLDEELLLLDEELLLLDEELLLSDEELLLFDEEPDRESGQFLSFMLKGFAELLLDFPLDEELLLFEEEELEEEELRRSSWLRFSR